MPKQPATIHPLTLEQSRKRYAEATRIEDLSAEDHCYLESLLDSGSEFGFFMESMGFAADKFIVQMHEEGSPPNNLDHLLRMFDPNECELVRFVSGFTLTVDVTKPLKAQCLEQLRQLAAGVQKTISEIESCSDGLLDERDLKAVKKAVDAVKRFKPR